MTDISSTRKLMEQLVRDYQRIVQKALASERRKLEKYRARMANLVERYPEAKPAPPKPLTIPTIFGPKDDENLVTRYLAYALDPAKNGIGEAPLAQLLRLCEVDAADLPLAEVTVYREYWLETGRIDLLLEWEDALVLGIENKIRSGEGPEQTVRYARAFRRQFKDIPYHLIYLTRGGKKPDSRAFQPVSYAQLVGALREVHVGDDVSARRRVLWEDLLEHLEVYIIMSDPEHFEFSDKAQLYLDHLDMIVDLASALSAEWYDAMSYIGSQVSAHLGDSSWNADFTTKQRPPQVYKSSWQSSEVWVHYEYYFSIEELRQGEFPLMVDVEGEQRERLLSLFDQRHPALEATYRERGIDYRPRSRKHAIAWKRYPVSGGIDQMVRALLDALDEFRFLEREIDDVLAEWQQQSEAVV
jgi:hypothetical protein